MSVHRCFWALSMLGLLSASGCKGNVSANAKVNNQGVDANAEIAEDKGDEWSGDDETDDPSKEPSEKRGRAVEPQAWDNTGPPKATFPGFRVFKDGTSRVFIEVSGHVPVKESESQGLLTYRFTGVHVPERVNTLSLPTQHFSTPVTLVEVRAVGDDAELLVHVREQVKPKIHLKRSDSGTVLSIDFPRYTAQRDGAQQQTEYKPSHKAAADPEK